MLTLLSTLWFSFVLADSNLPTQVKNSPLYLLLTVYVKKSARDIHCFQPLYSEISLTETEDVTVPGIPQECQHTTSSSVEL